MFKFISVSERISYCFLIWQLLVRHESQLNLFIKNKNEISMRDSHWFDKIKIVQVDFHTKDRLSWYSTHLDSWVERERERSDRFEYSYIFSFLFRCLIVNLGLFYLYATDANDRFENFRQKNEPNICSRMQFVYSRWN